MKQKTDRRGFLKKLTGLTISVGVFGGSWALIKSIFPDALAKIGEKKQIDLSSIEKGEGKTFEWNKKPIFVRHRTKEEIKQARSVSLSELIDPQEDEKRVIKPQWLVVIGSCTHMGCVPMGHKKGEEKGDYGGWFCGCHGAMYDISGRVRKGPAKKNLVVPKYRFIDETTIEIG